MMRQRPLAVLLMLLTFAGAGGAAPVDTAPVKVTPAALTAPATQAATISTAASAAATVPATPRVPGASSVSSAPGSTAAPVTLGAATAPASTVAATAASTPAAYSASALYNLGNSYARSGKLGMAVLNYERASLLDPNDPDLRANLQQARQAAGLPTEPRTRFDRVANIASPRIASWLGLAGLIVAGTSLLARKILPTHRRKFAAAAVVGIALIAITVCNAVIVWPTLRHAVVVTPTAQVRVSPVPMGEPLFMLREAEIVTTSARHDSFVLIQTRTGRQGWVSAENVAPVLPSDSSNASMIKSP